MSEGGGGVTIFDIGANKGQSIKFFSQIFDKPKMYAFEPSPRTFRTLKRFVEHLEGPDVSIHQIGIGDKEQTINFYESILSETSTFSLPNRDSEYLKKKNRILFQNSNTAFTSISTRVTTIDAFLNENKVEQIDVLKIDVEGFELEVIQGAQQALRDGKVHAGICTLNTKSLDIWADFRQNLVIACLRFVGSSLTRP